MLEHLASKCGFFGQISIVLFDGFNGDSSLFHRSLALLSTFRVVNEVTSSIRPRIDTASMLLAILPHSLKFLSIWVVHDSRASTVIVLKFALIYLTIGPEISAFTYFLALVERAIEKSSIRPLEQAFTVHGIIQEGPLVHFSSRGDAPTEPIDLAFLEVALKDSIARIDFKAHTVWLGRVIADLATELGPTSPLIKLHLHSTLCIHIVVKVVMLKVIERPKHLIDVFDCFITDFSHDIVIVL